jgi:hypothetical protein
MALHLACVHVVQRLDGVCLKHGGIGIAIETNRDEVQRDVLAWLPKTV